MRGNLLFEVRAQGDETLVSEQIARGDRDHRGNIRDDWLGLGNNQPTLMSSHLNRIETGFELRLAVFQREVFAEMPVRVASFGKEARGKRVEFAQVRLAVRGSDQRSARAQNTPNFTNRA